MDKRIWRSILLAALLLVGISQARADNHQVVIGTYEHGSVSASPAQNIAPGTQVTLTVKLDDGYIVNELKAYRKTQTGSGQAPRRVGNIDIGEEIPLTTVTVNSVYRLVMPDDDVEIVAEFRQALLPADPSQPVSQSNPILIYNVRDMVTLSQLVNAGVVWTKNAYFKVAEANAVFDFEGVEGFEPIGRYVNNVNPAFSSSFDGNGVTIKNLHVTGTNSYTGLFGYVRAASSGTHRIENIRIDKSCSFSSTANSVGAVVGTVLNTAISNCHNDGASVSGVQYVGGVIGYTSAVEVSGCSGNGNVSGRTMVGGLIGYCYSNTVLNNNSVGMSLSKDEQITVSITQNNNEVGAVAGTYSSGFSGSDNWYNGMAVVAKRVNTEYKGHGYGCALTDNAVIKSATGGYFPAVTGHNAKGLTWSYDLYEKIFTILGEPDLGYELTGVTVTYLDDEGNSQTVLRSEEQLQESWTFDVPAFPRAVSGTYVKSLKLLDESLANSKDNPYLVNSALDMVKLSRYVNNNVAWTKNAYFKVAEANAVFDFEGVEGFEPIGTFVNNANPGFSSSFDGNGVTIMNLHVNSSGNHVGLFGYARAASAGIHRIENIRIDKSCSFSSTANSVGAVVGNVLYTTVSNCHNDGASVSGNQYVGGVVGFTQAMEVSDCSSNGNVSGRTMVGGLIGYCYSNTVLNNNSVGMSLSKDEQLTVSITQNNNEVGAVAGTYSSGFSGSDNWYNGMAVVAKMVGTEYKGHGYGAALNDNNFIKSATAGYFPAVTGHNAKGLTWNYDLYEKVFTFAGQPDAGYKLASVTVMYLDDDGNTQSVTLDGEQLQEPWTFSLPSHPIGVSGTYEAALRLLDPTQANSKDNPYLVTSAQDMVTLSQAVNAGVVWTKNAWFKVAEANAVFDFEGVEGFEPIGGQSNTFQGGFDGNGVIIRNLHVSGSSCVGLFGYFNLGGRSLENITIDKNCSFTGTGGNVGSLAGVSISASNCHNLGAPVTAGGSNVGGLVGYSYNSIIDCSSNANVSGLRYVGGLVGYLGKDTGSRSLINNTVGMGLAQDEHITISSSNSAMGAVAGYCQNTKGSENYYNGMNVTVKYGNREYTGHGYGLMLNDNDYIKSATGGYFPVSIGHSKKGLTWSYNLYEKTFTVVGSPDVGYELTSVTVTYLDADGNSQTVSRSEEQLQESWTFDVPAFPRAVSATYKTAFALLDPTQPNSKENPYLIYTVQDMVALSQVVKAKPAWVVGAWFKVAEANAVFDFEGVEGFEPIGGQSNTFQGGFDGNGVTIKNLKMNGGRLIGLIGYVLGTGAQRYEIRGITIDKSCSFTGTGQFVGSVVGAGSNITIFDCHNAGAMVVSSNTYVGGIVGRVSVGMIDYCSSNANVSGSAYVGGIVGEVYSGAITNNTVGMDLTQGERIIVSSNSNMFGAIAGFCQNSSGVENYYNGMTVVGMYGKNEYHGHGYGSALTDNGYIKSATGGYFPAVTGHNAKGLTWSYDLYEKVFTFAGQPDAGYKLAGVTVMYLDDDGNSQSVTLNEEQLLGPWTFSLPSHPTGVSGTYETALRLLDPTRANSKDNPYLVTSAQDMVTLSQAVNAGVVWTKNAWFKVAEANAVFDFEGIEGFEPIGIQNNAFQGSFDGNGVTIRNLHVSGGNFTGLFGWVNASSRLLENITIDKNCSFTSTGSYVGALVGVGTVSISNCHNLGAPVTTVSSYAGGLVGRSNNNVSNCSSNANVTGATSVGGLIGVCTGSIINNTVGMGLAQDEHITITSNSNYFGAIAGNCQNTQGSENYYNGMTVVGKYGNKEYTGHGYGCSLTDNNYIKSATGGYCGVANVNGGKNVEWAYDLYTKTMTVKGNGATASYTAGMAPDLIKDDIESLVISEGVTGIGAKAFSGWTGLNGLTFDGCTLASAAGDALEGCTAMAEGTVMVNKRAPFAGDAGSDFLNVVTNGVLVSEEQLDLSGEVSHVGGEFLWKGGTFRDYRRERIIQGVTFNESRHWATFYTGESLAKPDDMSVYVVSGLDDDGVSVAEIGYIPANVGVLLYSDKPRNGFNTSVYTGNEESFVSLLRGSLNEQTLANEAGYVLYQDEFVLTTGGVLPANRCYLPIAEGGNAAPRLGITGIDSIADGGTSGDAGTEGNYGEEAWYTLNGLRLDHRPTSKGLYIYRGRKVVIK